MNKYINYSLIIENENNNDKSFNKNLTSLKSKSNFLFNKICLINQSLIKINYYV